MQGVRYREGIGWENCSSRSCCCDGAPSPCSTAVDLAIGLCENMQKPTRKEEDTLSTVGLIYNGNKIFAFGDSKGTTTSRGTTRHDIERGAIPKVFENNRFLFVTCGRNEFRENYFGKPEKRVCIEDWIRGNLEPDQDPFPFFTRFWKHLNQRHVSLPEPQNPSAFVFLAAEKNEEYCEYATIIEVVVSELPKAEALGLPAS